MVFTQGIRHTLPLWFRATLLANFLVGQTSLISFRAVTKISSVARTNHRSNLAVRGTLIAYATCTSRMILRHILTSLQRLQGAIRRSFSRFTAWPTAPCLAMEMISTPRTANVTVYPFRVLLTCIHPRTTDTFLMTHSISQTRLDGDKLSTTATPIGSRLMARLMAMFALSMCFTKRWALTMNMTWSHSASLNSESGLSIGAMGTGLTTTFRHTRDFERLGTSAFVKIGVTRVLRHTFQLCQRELALVQLQSFMHRSLWMGRRGNSLPLVATRSSGRRQHTDLLGIIQRTLRK
ncbi:hypothetical protein K239x_25650 [Planctomycetes bacterium K23_9]|uniref:Uncharacterized protein n=1 Tax=Stieleria marina TaxID=1930275 RepID=A0A517NU07_9BACT|nr:hypothetical protein K239x_25650 [Planctomycetes bacterium K23_9]